MRRRVLSVPRDPVLGLAVPSPTLAPQLGLLGAAAQRTARFRVPLGQFYVQPEAVPGMGLSPLANAHCGHICRVLYSMLRQPAFISRPMEFPTATAGHKSHAVVPLRKFFGTFSGLLLGRILRLLCRQIRLFNADQAPIPGRFVV